MSKVSGCDKTNNAQAAEKDTCREEKVRPLRSIAAEEPENCERNENDAEQDDEDAVAKLENARLLVSRPAPLDQVVHRGDHGLAAVLATATETHLRDAIVAQRATA